MIGPGSIRERHARILMSPQDRRQNDNELSEVGEAFSLSPAEGERAGVRGKVSSPVDQIRAQPIDATPHPFPLPFPRGEGMHHRSVVYPADSLVIDPFGATSASWQPALFAHAPAPIDEKRGAGD